MKQIDDLLAGFARFRANYFEKNPSLFEGLKRGQDPRFLVIACSDSRTDPAILFDAAPGDLFVVRNVANLVPPYVPDGGLHGVSSALEFGVRVLKVRHIIVLGHAHCAGIRALVTEATGEFVPQWMKIADPARRRLQAASGAADADRLAHACEMESIKVSLDNLLSFPWIAAPVRARELFLHGWYFDLDQGALASYDPDRDEFLPRPAC